ncbi:S66 family peptidase [Paenibacillus bovis]|uniref:Microcin immunity protein n=1 Tax=Paenibacillus bovis TaxID=1616788 RepID=A0A172ZGK0_9BACL|nr:S66 peptidase family protein [Paenibacillus bovis]ANF96775.1 microcin immunity protein [Paenibacillus bovis]
MEYIPDRYSSADNGFSYPSSQIIYPAPLRKGDRIAIIAPSSGVNPEAHHLLHRTREYLEQLGYMVTLGDSVWTNDKCVSLPKAERAAELQQFLLDEQVQAIIPPWGGEFLMELLPLLDWDRIREQPPKWILGFSDISTLTFAYTLQTGYASAHGPGAIDISGSDDPTTSIWLQMLTAADGQSVEQYSSTHYQTVSDHSQPGYNLDTSTEWRILGQEDQPEASLQFSGRLIGGCMDVITVLIGTKWAPVNEFIEHYAASDSVIWYLESCEMNAGDIYRHLWQMDQAGWFRHAKGILIGRPAGYSALGNFELTDALQQVFGDRNIPVVYGVDIGHIPPQLTLINGASAIVSVKSGQGSIVQTLD